MRISIVNQQTTHKWEKDYDALIRKTLDYIGKLRRLSATAEVNIVLVDSHYIRELNYVYRGVDKVTDVLSFSMAEKADEEPDYDMSEEDQLLGDIIICLDVAIRQAEEYGHTIERELAFLSTHGMLHLLGYDHEEEGERALMRSLEDKIMDELRITR
jgi:probable rRNA maturation factor